MNRLKRIVGAVALSLIFTLTSFGQVQRSMFRPFKGALTAGQAGLGSTPLVLSVDAGVAFCNGVYTPSAAVQLTLTGSALNYVYVDPTTCAPTFTTAST